MTTVFDTHPTLRRTVALAGTAALIAGVALVEGRASLGLLPLDAVIVLVPLATLALVPALRGRGVSGMAGGGLVTPLIVFLFLMAGSIVANGFAPEALATLLRYASYGTLMVALVPLAADAAFRRAVLWMMTGAGVVVSVIGLTWYVERVIAFRAAAADNDIALPAMRVYSTFANANFLGEYLVLVVGATLALAFVSRGWRRALAWIALAPVTLTLVLTYTRGSWLALAAALALTLIVVEARYVVAFSAAALAGVSVIPRFAARLASSFSTEGTAGFRIRLWRVAGEAMAARPLVGWGPGRFYDAFFATVSEHPWLGVGYAHYGAHNGYFTIAAETGIPGALVFVVLVGAIVRSGLRTMATAVSHMMRLEAAALTAGVGAFALNALTSNSFQHPQPALFFWVTAAMLAGAALEAARADAATSGASAAPRWRDTSWIAQRVAPAGRWFRRAWDASFTQRLILRPVREPQGLLAGSAVMRFIFGSGQAGADR